MYSNDVFLCLHLEDEKGILFWFFCFVLLSFILYVLRSKTSIFVIFFFRNDWRQPQISLTSCSPTYSVQHLWSNVSLMFIYFWWQPLEFFALHSGSLSHSHTCISHLHNTYFLFTDLNNVWNDLLLRKWILKVLRKAGVYRT